MTTLSGVDCEKTTRALGSGRKIQMQKAAENRVPRQPRVKTLLCMSCLLRTCRAQRPRNPPHDWHWWSSDLFCRTVFSMCHRNPVRKKFHDTVVVSCFELMCGRSQRQASSAKFAVHTPKCSIIRLYQLNVPQSCSCELVHGLAPDIWPSLGVAQPVHTIDQTLLPTMSVISFDSYARIWKH